MTDAVATSTSAKQTVPHAVPIVILGTDAVLAALPATAVQLAHACIEAGFVNVIPASWGDELIAVATLRRLPEFGDGPVIQCSCPIVAHRLLSVSGDLRPVLLPLVPPPVALARYVRALSQPNRARVTYVGGCPGATDESIDIRMTPDALLSLLAERGIDIDQQPRVFESFIPADRRRFRSQPGGLPTADALWSDHGARPIVEITGEDLAAEIAQHVLGGRNVLIDAAVTLGCVCSGANARERTTGAREFLASLEPPRATAPVVNENTRIEMDLQVPAAPRTPIDIMAVPSASATNGSTPARGASFSPSRGVAAIPDTRQSPRSSSPGIRAVGGNSPVARPADAREGKTLPRAYIARRGLSPRSTPVVPAEPLSEPAPDKPEPAVAGVIETPSAQEAEPFEPVAFDFRPPLSSEEIVGMELPAPDKSQRTELRIGRLDSSETDDQLDVAIPLSHWTEPATSQSKNAEVFDAHWSAGNGDGSAAGALARVTPSRFESPARADEPAQLPYTPLVPLNPRHVVFMLIAAVVIAAVVSASIVTFFERQFTSRAAAPTSSDSSR